MQARGQHGPRLTPPPPARGPSPRCRRSLPFPNSPPPALQPEFVTDYHLPPTAFRTAPDLPIPGLHFQCIAGEGLGWHFGQFCSSDRPPHGNRRTRQRTAGFETRKPSQSPKQKSASCGTIPPGRPAHRVTSSGNTRSSLRTTRCTSDAPGQGVCGGGGGGQKFVYQK